MSNDISLPNVISFDTLDPPPSMDDFLEVSDKNYDIAYVVKVESSDKIARLILITPDKERIMLEFDARARIGIKGFNLHYNAENLLHIDTVCNKSEDGKHSWQSKLQSGTFHLKSCSNCGRYVANQPI